MVVRRDPILVTLGLVGGDGCSFKKEQVIWAFLTAFFAKVLTKKWQQIT